MKLILICALLLFSASCNNTQPVHSAEQSKLGLDTTIDTYSVTSEDASMNSAIAKARQTLSNFDKSFQSKKPEYTDFAVKKPYKTDDGGHEHMWIALISIEDRGYKGYVNNDAEKTHEVKYGDTVFVGKKEITDWMYLENNVLRGGYTIREIRSHLTSEERSKMDEELGFKIEDQ